ncbi:muellerian-inhibiting factor-like [Osmerus mordax]|uniref:muellerian-inhibiting factor-like n=1 Tax=Osmerus mordax TaxID=8014 RepID=UPI00351004A5
MSYERLLSLQSLNEVPSPWRGLTLNRCLVLALLLVLVSTSSADEGVGVEGADQHTATSSLHPGAPRGDPGGPLEHMLSALREWWPHRGEQGGNEALVRFGVCPGSERGPVAALARLAGAGDRLHVMHPDTELVEEDGGGGGRLVLTFHLPLSPLLKQHPVLALASRIPMTTSDMEVSFNSPALQPPTQTLCLSSKTQYLVLTGQPSEGHKWRVSVTLKTPERESGQNLSELQRILIGGEAASGIIMTPLLLLPLDRATGEREPPEPCPFLCQIHSFLSEVLPQVPLQTFAPFPLASLPPLPLGPSSSEALILGLINSSGPTLFSFPQRRAVLRGQGGALLRGQGGALLRGQSGELSLTPSLLESLRLRLAEAVGRLGREELGFSGMDRLRRLQELSALPRPGEELPAGVGGSRERQFRALLLLKALHMVQGQREVKRGLRAARASPERSPPCQLHSLTVSLDRFFMDAIDIKNCEGSCHFPLLHNINNHVILLNSQVQGGRELVRSPCCVPLEYEPLVVVEVGLDNNGVTISRKENMVAKQCGCR